MTRIRHGLALSLLFAALLVQAQQQPAKPSALAQNLKVALAELQKHPEDPAVQARYLKVFPKDFKTFLALFGPGHELYDGHEYILILPGLAEHHEVELGKLLVGLSRDAEYDADAPSYLQHVTTGYAASHTKVFLKLVRALPPKKRDTLITFLADVEALAGDPAYQSIVDHLRELGDHSLAKEFEAARAERARRVDH